MILAFLGSKGGTGKTTLAIHVAAGLALDGARVLLVDTDTQGSALDWSAIREGDMLFQAVGLPKATLHRDSPRLASGRTVLETDPKGAAADEVRDLIAEIQKGAWRA